jgi:hypothetical protein
VEGSIAQKPGPVVWPAPLLDGDDIAVVVLLQYRGLRNAKSKFKSEAALIDNLKCSPARLSTWMGVFIRDRFLEAIRRP